MTDPFVYRVRLGAPPAAVYRALTEPADLCVWLAEAAHVSIPDERYEFWGRYTPGGDRARQRLLSAERDRLLQFSWELEGEDTLAEISLQPDGPGKTVLRLSQTGVPAWPAL